MLALRGRMVRFLLGPYIKQKDLFFSKLEDFNSFSSRVCFGRFLLKSVELHFIFLQNSQKITNMARWRSFSHFYLPKENEPMTWVQINTASDIFLVV